MKNITRKKARNAVPNRGRGEIFSSPQLQYKLAIVKLQQQRANCISLWRACLLISCTIGLASLTVLPFWQIRKQTQIQITGAKLVSEDTIYQSLDFAYPQFIWAVNGIELTLKLESIPSVELAKVNRQLIPPTINVSLQEKVPVALATFEGKIGFLNSSGDWVDQKFYANLNTNYSLPKLKVVDYKNQFQPVWVKLYQLISLYPELQISEVHWNQGGSLFVQTKLGQVLLGNDDSRLEQQFKILLRLRNLPQHLSRSEIAYIDLSNSRVNLIQKY